jgi:hypothetical protein
VIQALNGAPGLAADDRGQVTGCEPDGCSNGRERDRFVVVLVDELEHGCQQRLAVDSQVFGDVNGDPGGADEQEREVREGCLGGAVTRLGEFVLDRGDVFAPSGALTWGHG